MRPRANHRHDIRVPVHIQDVLNRARRERKPVRKLAGVTSAFAAEAELYNFAGVSLESPTGRGHSRDGEERTLGSFLASDATSPDELLITSLDDHATREKIAGALTHLRPREAEVVELRFLADDTLTLAEIGERFDISRERVRQIEALALRKLRGILRSVEYTKIPVGAAVARDQERDEQRERDLTSMEHAAAEQTRRMPTPRTSSWRRS